MPRQRSFRNNARLVLLTTAGALVAFLAVQLLLRKSRDFAPDFLASVLLYGLTVLNLTLLLVLVFILGRNLVRVLMERRRKVLGARFRMRLLLVFLLMAIAPSVLLIVVGSDLIQQAIDRWFSVDVERILSSSQALGTALRESVADRSRIHARALAREIAARGALSEAGRGGLRRLVEARARELRMDMVNVFVPEGELLAVMDPRLPPASDTGPSGETVADAALGGTESEAVVPFPLGDLVRVAVPVRDRSGGVQGAVVVSTLLPGGVAAEAREVQERYTKFRKTEAVKDPIKALYVSVYLFPALLILFGAVWLSLYLARRITTPLRLLDLDPEGVGRPLEEALPGSGRDELRQLVHRLLSGRSPRQQREVMIPAHGRDRHLAVTVVPLPGPPGSPPGAVAVLDDLTPLMRAQKVAAWGEVARKLAHEIKNPLTPIQLSAQRIRKAHLKSAPDFEKVLAECTNAIVAEVEALKNLVDEFAQFARLPAAHLMPSSLHDVIDQTLSLYDGLFTDVRIDRRFAPDLPALRLDADQMKRVLINLVDNAIEATDKKGTVVISTEFDRSHGRVRLGVADDGPGIAAEDRDRLFVPHFSTKKRGSGLGLAIVSRIVQEHQGVIRVEDNRPHGARFVVELPA